MLSIFHVNTEVKDECALASSLFITCVMTENLFAAPKSLLLFRRWCSNRHRFLEALMMALEALHVEAKSSGLHVS